MGQEWTLARYFTRISRTKKHDHLVQYVIHCCTDGIGADLSAHLGGILKKRGFRARDDAKQKERRRGPLYE
jgi:hypothetical protein